ncbi:ATP-dependent Clp protease proteolytic subunit [Microbacterium sp. STF-2]|uniref:head maturation protease, ClpP-related n=1 Tax=Microbacterium sp. STF-2 TaxID=3031132 RepID=UPI002AFF4769|nr:head maturation protease, ClpP-related [Microbacterium sp. STF-2]MEA1264166.1 ATP-dependent Clp protease proteolytic subunit [Microbacterium sp. STF-2]
MTKRNPNRYWGSATPPKSKAEFFDAITTPAAGSDDTIATIRMYGPIDSYGGWWGISAGDVSDVLDNLPDTVTHIILRINSPGGEVWEAMSILNMFRAHTASVTAVVDGIAASAGSFLAVGCDETVMSPGSQMMIHSPLTWDYGNAADLRKTAEVLDSVEESIITIYRDKAGESAWGELLAAETWYTAQEAVTAGLADRVAVVKDAGETLTPGTEEPDLVLVPAEGDDIDDVFEAARARLGWHPTGAIAPTKLPSSPEPGITRETETLDMSDTFLAYVRDRLGVPEAEASEETVKAALDEVLTEQADTPVQNVAPAGAVVMDAAQHQKLVDDATAGRAAREQQISDRRDGIVKAALDSGRIAPSSAESWRTQLDNDEQGISTLLNSFPANTIPVEELGHGEVHATADDANYSAIYTQKGA